MRNATNSHRLALVFIALVLTASVEAKDKRMSEYAGISKVPADKALVVFMRASSYGGLVKATVYDISTDQTKFLGISTPKTQIGYLVTPGKKLFMVIAESADFMDADIEAGKTYYVLVSPRMGMWKARFSLLPIRNDTTSEHNIHSKDFAKWRKKSKWVESTAGAHEWYTKNQASVEKSRTGYLKKWSSRSAEDKKNQYLHAQDGQ